MSDNETERGKERTVFLQSHILFCGIGAENVKSRSAVIGDTSEEMQKS